MTTTKKKIGIAAIIGAVIAAILALTKKAAKKYCCPYCGVCFATYEELVEHVKTEHPGERIPLPIEWD